MSGWGMRELLSAHEPMTAQAGIYCSCDEWGRNFDGTGSPDPYSAHIAAVITSYDASEQIPDAQTRESEKEAGDE